MLQLKRKQKASYGTKTLEKGSVWEEADTNGDGVVTDREMAIKERMVLLENRDKKKINKKTFSMVFCYHCNFIHSRVNDAVSTCR